MNFFEWWIHENYKWLFEVNRIFTLSEKIGKKISLRLGANLEKIFVSLKLIHLKLSGATSLILEYGVPGKHTFPWLRSMQDTNVPEPLAIGTKDCGIVVNRDVLSRICFISYTKERESIRVWIRNFQIRKRLWEHCFSKNVNTKNTSCKFALLNASYLLLLK